jgi:DNA (cytosine-5)-methyltransferase 1
MKLVILESPYAGDIEANVEYARACVRDSLSRGEAPIASHLLYTQPGILRDEDPHERQWGIDAGLAWGNKAEATVLYIDRGISRGMEYGIANAEKAGRPVDVLDLFSGIGGFSLGLERAGMRTVAFCEIEPFARRVLAKHWPHVPRYDDVRNLTADRLASDGIAVDVICGGFPCQDVSSSGPAPASPAKVRAYGLSTPDLFASFDRVYVIVENVADLLHRGLADVLGDLASSGYDAEWRCVPASVVGLPQTRDRMWIVAYPGRRGLQAGHERQPLRSEYFRWADDDRLGAAQLAAKACTARAWRSDDGLPGWVDRMRGLGNSVAPQIPEAIGRA